METHFTKKNINPLNWKTALVFAICIALLINLLHTFTMIFGDRFVEWELNAAALIRTVRMLFTGTFVLFVLYLFAFKAIQLPLKPRVKDFVVIVGTFLLVIGISTALILVMLSVRDVESQKMPIVVQLISALITSLVVWITTSQVYLNYLRQQTLLENERLIAENIRNRYEALKNQIDPHFLFNSLNTLNGLIGFDNDRAHEYVEKMSSVLRYTIQNKEITTLKDEITIANSYAYLIRIRYGDSFRIETDIAEKYLSYNIIPISVQHLIENAVKHNVVSAKYPLVVRIYTTGADTLVVENDIRPKEFTSAGSGIGLANFCERYRLLFHKEVIISNIDNVFRVEIPLIRV